MIYENYIKITHNFIENDLQEIGNNSTLQQFQLDIHENTEVKKSTWFLRSKELTPPKTGYIM